METTHTQQEALDELDVLLQETKRACQEMERARESTHAAMTRIEGDVRGSVEKLEGLFSEMDQIEKEAAKALKALLAEAEAEEPKEESEE